MCDVYINLSQCCLILAIDADTMNCIFDIFLPNKSGNSSQIIKIGQIPGEREARESRQRRVALIRRLAKAKQEATGETGSGDAATGTLWMLMEEMLKKCCVVSVVLSISERCSQLSLFKVSKFPKQCGNTWGSYGNSKSRGG